jgi:hypothetical protein
MLLNEIQISQVRRELKRRREILIRLALDQSAQLDKLDRQEILRYLEQGLLPERPHSVPDLMKAFVNSCFTYAVLRNFCTSILGEIPTPETIGECLARVFGFGTFRLEETWLPEKLRSAAEEIQAREQYNLYSNEPRPRIIRVLIDGSAEMGRRLDEGLSAFYSSLDTVTHSAPEIIWKYAEDFSDRIYNVGPALVCDFLKEIGYSQFVKVDHHFKKQFPSLIHGGDACKKLSHKSHFILSLHLAERLGMTPYHLDKTLYQWGRYGELTRLVQ